MSGWFSILFKSSQVEKAILTSVGLSNIWLLDGSETERTLVEDLAQLHMTKGRGGSVKMKTNSRPQRKKSAAPKANRKKNPPSPGPAGMSAPILSQEDQERERAPSSWERERERTSGKSSRATLALLEILKASPFSFSSPPCSLPNDWKLYLLDLSDRQFWQAKYIQRCSLVDLEIHSKLGSVINLFSSMDIFSISFFLVSPAGAMK